MNTRNVLASARMLAVALFASLFIAACGGSGSSTEPGDTRVTPPTTGTVGLLFTDKPTDDYESIELIVSGATLIGEDDSHHVLFTSEPGEERHIDLLDLTNYHEPVIFGEVNTGTYKKIRLQLDDIVLTPKGGEPSSIQKLPANGKVDLLQPDGFDVLPGRTLMIEIDVDANKAFKVTGAGNSGKVNFRPVVRVNVFDVDNGELPYKLVRLEGAVSGEPNAGDGTFVLCSIDAPDFCVDVATSSITTSFFNDEGFYSDFAYLADGNMVVVIGEYGTDPIVLNAFVVENGPDVGQVTGDVVSRPANGEFLVLTIDEQDYVVELQLGTRFYNASGAIPADQIALADRVEVEGVIPPGADPDVIRAALVFLEVNDDDQLSGTIGEPITDTEEEKSFVLVADAGDTLVCVFESTSILLVDETNSTVTPATFAELAVDQVVDVFGTMPEGEGCFEANDVIVEVPPPASE